MKLKELGHFIVRLYDVYRITPKKLFYQLIISYGVTEIQTSSFGAYYFNLVFVLRTQTFLIIKLQDFIK